MLHLTKVIRKASLKPIFIHVSGLTFWRAEQSANLFCKDFEPKMGANDFCITRDIKKVKNTFKYSILCFSFVELNLQPKCVQF